MKFYRRFPGDYAPDTAQLKMIEHGAYTLMLDAVYATERPLPHDVRDIYRIVRAVSRSEREAVRSVLTRYWTRTPAGWMNARAERELARTNAKSDRARASARARWGEPEPDDGTSPEAAIAHAEQVVQLYRECCPMLPQPKAISTGRVRAIGTISRKHFGTLDEWRQYFRRVADTPYLTGKGSKGFRAALDWLLRPANVLRVIESTYGETGDERKRRTADRDRQHAARLKREQRLARAAMDAGVYKTNMSVGEIVEALRKAGKLPPDDGEVEF